MEPDHDVVVGQRQGWGVETPFGLDGISRRQHTYLIGQTGSGKSTLMRNLILQDIEQGRGVALIDPHGDLALEVLDEIPAYRTGEVVYFNPGDDDPLGINLFRATTDNWHLIASGIVSAFKKIWGDSWGPRLEYILYAAVAALAQCDNTSLLGLSRMLSDANYRAWVVKQVHDPMVRSFWLNEFAHYEKGFRQEVIGPVQNKVGQFFLAPSLRHVLGQVGTKINFRFMMDHHRIFIANLSKGMIGETHSSLLGSLLVTGFELAALSRADTPQGARQPFLLYADEFHHYATESFASVLSEARKYGLALTIAHQYLGQLSEQISDAVFGNVGTFLAFRVSEADAAVLERQFGSVFSRNNFTGLENFEICVRLLNKEPLLARSLPPLQPCRRRAKIVMRHSRRKYCSSHERVKEKIDRWMKRRH
jgi:energy-coupling factor transporter ATP-binding protein EcfA2